MSAELSPVVLTRVQARRVLAYLRALECAVLEGDVQGDALPMWTQLEEVIVGLDGLSLTVDAVREALGEDDDEDGGGEEDGVREPREPPPSGGLAFAELDVERAPIERPHTQPPTTSPPASARFGGFSPR
jgi:hypothetical protein